MLNKQQTEAVKHIKGPLLILAGAGSGKTKTVTHRIAHLIKNGVGPSNVLAITFTNKAAKEMKERTESIVGKEVNIWIKTFHSTCLNILKENIEATGYKRGFSVLIGSEQKDLLNECVKDLNLEEVNPYGVLSNISSIKDGLLSPDEFKKKNKKGNQKISQLADIYKLYQSKLKKINAMDFDDLIFQTVKMFKNHPDILNYYQEKFKYIHVDEYQDTNYSQYVLVNMLAQKHKNLCVVGDDDQSIYGWRGANIKNILNFEADFENCKVIKLEQNYRSTQTILTVANDVITNNFERKQKKLWCDKEKGSPVFVFSADNERVEVDFIMNKVKEKIKEGYNYSDIAVLYRTNAQSRIFEEGLTREGIPYDLVGALNFYDRKEIKDLLGYLKLISNPDDDIALRRIINVPPRKIGEITINNLRKISEEEDINMFNSAINASQYPELKQRAEKLQEFTTLIKRLRKTEELKSLTYLVEVLLDKTGLLSFFEKGDEERVDNLKEFQSIVASFEEANSNARLIDLLENIQLSGNMTKKQSEDGDKISLMTFHTCKGLEFPVVFMTGVEKGLFPSFRSSTSELLEEERRLCYVGITRAMKELYISYARRRMLYGKTSAYGESVFVGEIGKKHTQKLEYNDTLLISRTITPQQSTKKNTPGDIVEHKKFGSGVILKKEGNILWIDFSGKIKKVVEQMVS